MFPLAGGHTLYLLSTSKRPKSCFLPLPSKDFPPDTDVICVCGYCNYSSESRPLRSKYLWSLGQLSFVYLLYARMKRESFVRDFFANKVLSLSTVQGVRKEPAPHTERYWSDVSLYPHFVWYRVVRKIENLLAKQKAGKCDRLAIAMYMAVLSRLNVRPEFDFAFPVIPVNWQRQEVGARYVVYSLYFALLTRFALLFFVCSCF